MFMGLGTHHISAMASEDVPVIKRLSSPGKLWKKRVIYLPPLSVSENMYLSFFVRKPQNYHSKANNQGP